MTGAFFEVELDDTAMTAAFDRLENGYANPQPLFEKIGAYGVRSTQERFISQIGPDGAAWRPWIPAYAELRGPGSILTRSGALGQSLNFQASLSEVRWGSPMVYAAVHQFGAVIVPKTKPALSFQLAFAVLDGRPAWVHVQSVVIPARPYLGLNEADREEIVALTGDYTQELLDGF